MGNKYGCQSSNNSKEEYSNNQKTSATAEELTTTTKKRRKSLSSADYSLNESTHFNLLGLVVNQHHQHQRRKSWSSRINHISKSNPNLPASTSNRDSPIDARTFWPITQTERFFLPYFKIYERPVDTEYRIERLIDGGAFGDVFQVEDKVTKENYALKVLNKSKLINSGSVKQIRHEVEIQSICGHHPFIVECISYWQSRTQIFILLELITGGELFDTITSFTLDLARIYIAEIATALDFLQNAGIIYRDLKPENILLDNDYHIKLTDFGLSKWLKIGERTRTICGTVEYMAPEIFKGEFYGHAADWWSLGVITFLMFTRKFPVWNSTQQPNGSTEKTGVVDVKCVPLPDNLDQTLEPPVTDLLRRLFERNPRYRLKSLLELQRISMFKGFSFEDCHNRKLQPKLLLQLQQIVP